MSILQEAMKYYGLAEVPDAKSNPTILTWIKRFFPDAQDDSEVPWCSIFMHMVMQDADVSVPAHINPMARSWLSFGTRISVDEAKPGDLVIFWRHKKASPYGHVGIFVNRIDDNYINVLGGNQSNAVSIRPYKIDKLLGVQRLEHQVLIDGKDIEFETKSEDF